MIYLKFIFVVQKMIGLRAELENMNKENKQLRAMLSQVNNNYSALQMHVVTLMQRQHNRRAEISLANEVIMTFISRCMPRSFIVIDLLILGVVCLGEY